MPGTIYLLEPETSPETAVGTPDLSVQTHNLDPAQVLRLAQTLGNPVKRILLVGCEPAPGTGNDDMQMGLSEPVHRAVDEAVPLIEGLISEILHKPARAESHMQVSGQPLRFDRAAF